MSFEAGPSLESQDGAGFDLLILQVTEAIYALFPQIQELRKLLTKVYKSAVPRNQDIVRLTKASRDTAEGYNKHQQVVGRLEKVHISSLNNPQKLVRERILKEFLNLSQDYLTLQNEVQERLSTIRPRRAKGGSIGGGSIGGGSVGGGSIGGGSIEGGSTGGAGDGLVEAPRDTTNLVISHPSYGSTAESVTREDAEFQQSLVADREQELARVHQGVNEVNLIFRDLGALVTEQRSQVDAIENNISSHADETENAHSQLLKADRSQRKRQKCSWILLVVLFVVLLIVLAAVST